MESHTVNCDCHVCNRRRDFALDPGLLGELVAGNVTVFAGAGVSTESHDVLKSSLYETISTELDNIDKGASFPEVMERYASQPNGRFRLLKQITDRLDNIDSFPELAREATRFHRELGTFFPVRSIITTNWDTYFERFCNATAFVTDPDLAFWEAAGRRVLKIHGSVTNYGTIVATSADYADCERRLREGLIGGLLTTILATQTVLFVGYSLSDSDFRAIYGLVRARMESLHRQAYVVTPSAAECERFAREGLIPIQTDGAYFFERVKEQAVAQGIMLADSLYDDAEDLLDRIRREHDLLWDSVKMTDLPEMVFAAVYQDGMIHALERATTMRGSGDYSDPCRSRGVAHLYLGLRKQKLRNRQYADVAYIEGYVNALTYLLMEPDERSVVEPPLYFAFGATRDLSNLPSFLAEFADSTVPHQAAHKNALRKVESFSDPDSTVVHHLPWL